MNHTFENFSTFESHVDIYCILFLCPPEKYDSKTGFMAMEKWTGWHASIVMQKIIDGTIKKGAYPIEKALSGESTPSENDISNLINTMNLISIEHMSSV